jgi:pyrroline-5-carboxylate reductase
MPNTPALLGKGVAVIVRGGKAKPQDEKLTLTLFRGVGEALSVKDEALMDPGTGLSGSGPAYLYLFAEALIAGGTQEGLSPKVATQLAFQTLEGAVAMLKEAGKSPKELREMVASPGGTTLAGLSRLEEGQFSATVAAAISAATKRSKELGQS